MKEIIHTYQAASVCVCVYSSSEEGGGHDEKGS